MQYSVSYIIIGQKACKQYYKVSKSHKRIVSQIYFENTDHDCIPYISINIKKYSIAK